MAAAFSRHLINSFGEYPIKQIYTCDRLKPSMTSITTSGAMEFNPQMHGTPRSHSMMTESSSAFNSYFNNELSDETTLKIASLQTKLNQKLGPEFISQRPGPGGGPKLTYAEGWKIINLANEVFGFNGWSSSIINLTTDFVDFNQETKRYSVGTTAIIRVTLRDGVFHEDIGYGMLENSKSQGMALDKCKKEAVTDGLKRALRNFGNLLGNCLYDKNYTQEIVKMKVPPAKFDKSVLYRRPEFEEKKPDIKSDNIIMTRTDNKHLNNKMDCSPTNQNQSLSPTSIPPQPRLDNFNTSGPSKTEKNAELHPVFTESFPLNARQVTAEPPDRKPLPTKLKNSNLIREQSTISELQNHSTSRPKLSVTTAPLEQVVTNERKDEEASSHFGSDDDAFLANVDLGNCDLGQPVLPETDLGAPIEGQYDEFETTKCSSENSLPSINAVSTDHRQNQDLLLGEQQGISPTMPAPDLPQKPIQPPEKLHGFAGPARTSTSYRPYNTSTHRQVSNLPLEQTEKDRPRQACRKLNLQQSIVPSVGGFKFPPGNLPEHLAHPHVSFQNPSTSCIGQKRPFVATSVNSTNVKRSPGMGLESRAPGQASISAQKDVCRALEVGMGRGVKRIRR